MRCEYNDGLKIDYSGSLHMSKGDKVDIFLNVGDIPAGFKSDLDSVAKSCTLLRTVAKEVTAAVGYNLGEE